MTSISPEPPIPPELPIPPPVIENMANVDEVDEDDNAVVVVRVKRLNQHIGAFVASLGGFVLGISIGWNSYVVKTLNLILEISNLQMKILSSIMAIGASLGVLLLPFAIKFFKRITLILLSLPIFLIGWTLICLAGDRILLLMLGRSICGIAGGTLCVLVPIYVAEIAEKEIRGRLLSLFQLLIDCGILYAFLLAYIVDEEDAIWRYSVICAVPCAVMALVVFLPESPLYHLIKKDEDKAKESLKSYRDSQAERVDSEIGEWKLLSIESMKEKITWKNLTNLEFQRSCLICMSVMLVQQISGVNAIIINALSIFIMFSPGDWTPSVQIILISIVQIFSCFLSTLFVDYLGRRFMLTMSSALMGLFLLLLGSYMKEKEADVNYETTHYWMPQAWITLLFASYNLGVGPISWSLLGDTFPTKMKITAASLITSFNWILSFIVSMSFMKLLLTFGPTNVLWALSSVCFFASFLFIMFVKNSHGKSLIEIQNTFGTTNR